MELNWTYQSEKVCNIKQFLNKEAIPRNFIKAVKYSGGDIQLNGKSVTVRAELNQGDLLTVIAPIEEGHETVKASSIPIEVVYEDRDYLIVNKPSETVSIPSMRDPNTSMANRIKGYYARSRYLNQVIHIVTRLDRDTTGLMLIAKHRLAHAFMDRIIRQKQLSKIYYAISHRTDWPSHGYIDGPIARDPESIISRMVDQSGQSALTEYWLEQQMNHSSLMRIQLHTGRTHQIRVHMASEKGPLVGDDLYGGIKYPELNRQALHCGELEFIQPFTQETIQIKQDLPEDMSKWINKQ